MQLRFAVIGGAGVMGRDHVAHIRANPRCTLAAVVDPAPGAADFTDVDALLAAAGVALDGAVVAAPNDLHAPVTLRLLEAGIPVLVEKPIAGSLDDAAAIVRAAEETGVPVLVGHHRRHSAYMRAAVECIARGDLGRIAAVQVTTLFHKHPAYFAPEWRRQTGPILINLVHDVDNLRALAGEVVAVQAMRSNRIRGFEAEDTAAVLLEFGSGALGTLLLSDAAVSPRSWEQTTGENPAYPRDASQDCIFVSGTHGSLAIPTMRVWRQAQEPSWYEPFVESRIDVGPTVDPVARQLDHFCDVVQGSAAPLVTAASAMRSLAVTLAIREASATGGRVTLEA